MPNHQDKHPLNFSIPRYQAVSLLSRAEPVSSSGPSIIRQVAESRYRKRGGSA